MADLNYLTSERLFVIIPPSPEVRGLLQDYLYVVLAPFPDLVHNTYFELRQGSLNTVGEILAVWEIRLSLLLFSDQLSAAKHEAVNLNNALYGHENPGSGPSIITPTGPPNSKLVPPVMPLPNNNDGKIPDSLLTLLLSLKAAPNLARVHELYRLCYQRRLKGPSENSETNFLKLPQTDIQVHLMALAYAVVAVLLVSRNYSTLVSYAASMRTDLQAAIARENEHKKENKNTNTNAKPNEIDDLHAYYSNFTFIWLVAKIHVRRSAGQGHKLWGAVDDPDLQLVSEATWKDFAYVRTKISPRINGELAPLEALQGLDSGIKLATAIENDHISVRTLCCLLGLWSVAATHGAVVNNHQFTAPENDSTTTLGKAYFYVFEKWTVYFNKLYGLE